MDVNGSEVHELRFRDLTTGRDLDDVVHGVYYGAAWSADSEMFFYVKPDAAVRPYQVWRHRLGTSPDDDVLVIQEDDERFELNVELSKSERYIFITASSQVTSECRFLASDRPEDDPTLIAARRAAVEYDMGTRERTIVKEQPVRGGYKREDYVSERLWATAPDGVDIPISLVFKRGMRRDGSPLLLYGYGAYEHSNDPMFDPARLSLLDRGFVFAIAHVRGGGEMGREGYEGGRLLHKRNTFDDFIACADHRVAAGYTMPAKLAIRGRSAGGLLIGAVLNQRPELFACAAAQVPFVDALTTMLDDKLPLTVNEYDEWGNPAEPEFYSYIKSYSPTTTCAQPR